MTAFLDHYFGLIVVLIWFSTGVVFFFAFKDIFKKRRNEFEHQNNELPQHIYSEKVRRVEMISLHEEIARRNKFDEAFLRKKAVRTHPKEITVDIGMGHQPITPVSRDRRTGYQ
ncbi:hypothetical protein DXT88_06225 [Herbaspirillum lusitanum]|uniref:hypothetical protein n=1 Tax=Herbaspirillum lusitanum TaxID=213312 RepID=UPI002237BB52|nr:hypothetical protein [Herbaspirillum lusitanum]MCW5297769.1 hypothetical protein [Herbaspirillum lusitanum]